MWSVAPMRLVSGYIRRSKYAGRCLIHCRVRIYLPDDMRDTPIVTARSFPTIPVARSPTLRVEATAGTGRAKWSTSREQEPRLSRLA
jgi:hypothetical protein